MSREKLQQLLAENAIGEEEFAYCLGIEPDQAAALCQGRKQPGRTLARQIEQTFSKPDHWLDSGDDSAGPNYDLFGGDV